MVIIDELNCFLKDLDGIEWFSKISSPLKETKHIQINDTQEAVKYWKSFEFKEAGDYAWESFRMTIVENSNLHKIWEDYYEKLRVSQIKKLEQSSKAKSLIITVGDSLEDFCSELPIIGAVGELIAKHTGIFEGSFFSDQMYYYKKGHWVCGWNGTVIDELDHYPESDFFVI
jgi:hypothetical protein